MVSSGMLGDDEPLMLTVDFHFTHTFTTSHSQPLQGADYKPAQILP